MFKKFIIYILMCSIYSTTLLAISLVEVTKLTYAEVNPLQKFNGTVNFDQKSLLAAQNSGLVKKIYFKIGNKVKKGQVLVKIDDELLQSKINAALANLKIAKDEQKNYSKDFTRYKKLLSSKSITQKEYDNSLLKLNSSLNKLMVLQANLKEFEIQKKQKSIKAPFSGIIVEKKINLGEWVNAGSPIAKIVNTKSIELTFNIPSSFVNALNFKEKYTVLIGGKTFKSSLIAIIPNGDKITRTFPIKFKTTLKSAFVFDGQEAKISLAKSVKKRAMVLPRDSVIKNFGQNVVFAINEKSLAIRIPIKIIGFDGNKIAIEGKGLVEGMDIVSKGNERIFPNTPVKVINK